MLVNQENKLQYTPSQREITAKRTRQETKKCSLSMSSIFELMFVLLSLWGVCLFVCCCFWQSSAVLTIQKIINSVGHKISYLEQLI